MRWASLITVAVGIHVAAATANFKARLYSSGVEFLTQSDQTVEKALEQITFPNASYSEKVAIGKFYVVSSFDVKKARFPKFEFFLSDEGITHVSQGGKLELEGNWSAKYKLLFKLPTSGWAKANFTGIRVKLSAKVVSEKNQPRVRLGQCVVELANASITVHERGIPWSTKIFNVHSKLRAVIKLIVREQICSIANTSLERKYNMYLSSVPLHIPIGLNSSIDYTLQQMIYSKNFFDAMATAVVTEQCSSTEVENWTEDDLVPKMAVFWLSDIIPQCLLENAHSRRLFDYDVTKETASTAPFLSTSCSLSTFCVGRFFERLRNEYPEEYVDLHLHTLKAPIVQMGGDILTVVTSLAIDLHMNSNRTDDKPLARIELESTALLKPEIVNNTLSGSMSGIHNEFKLAFSQIGMPSKALLALLENAVSETLISMVETIVQAGVPLPIHSSVALSDQSEIRVFDRCIRVNADFIPN